MRITFLILQKTYECGLGSKFLTTMYVLKYSVRYPVKRNSKSEERHKKFGQSDNTIY